MHKLWRIAILLALITSACRIEANVDLVIEEDGSGTYASEIGYDEELAEALGGFIDIGDALSSFEFGVPNSTTSERVEADMTYSVVSSSFDDANTLATQIQENLEDNTFDRFDLSVDEEGATVDLALQIPEDIAGQLSQAGGLADTLNAEFQISVTMPGRIVSSNADRTVDNQLIWEVDFTDPDVVITAESTFQEDSFPFWIIILLILVAAALAGWWFWSRRQQQDAVARIEAAQAEAGAGQGWPSE